MHTLNIPITEQWIHRITLRHNLQTNQTFARVIRLHHKEILIHHTEDVTEAFNKPGLKHLPEILFIQANAKTHYLYNLDLPYKKLKPKEGEKHSSYYIDLTNEDIGHIFATLDYHYRYEVAYMMEEDPGDQASQAAPHIVALFDSYLKYLVQKHYYQNPTHIFENALHEFRTHAFDLLNVYDPNANENPLYRNYYMLNAKLLLDYARLTK